MWPVCVMVKGTSQLCSHSNAGELDPDRMGSGIQYGDARLRRYNNLEKESSEKKSCNC